MKLSQGPQDKPKKSYEGKGNPTFSSLPTDWEAAVFLSEVHHRRHKPCCKHPQREPCMKDSCSNVVNEAEDVLERLRHVFLVVQTSQRSESCQ